MKRLLKSILGTLWLIFNILSPIFLSAITAVIYALWIEKPVFLWLIFPSMALGVWLMSYTWPGGAGYDKMSNYLEQTDEFKEVDKNKKVRLTKKHIFPKIIIKFRY